MSRIILASASPARRSLLLQAGIIAETNPTDLDEEALKTAYLAADPTIAPGGMAVKLAVAKAVSVSDQNPDALVIGGDQVLALGLVRYDKPKSVEEARAQLQALRGKTHHLETAIACARGGEVIWSTLARPALHMREFSDAFLDAYLTRMGAQVMQTVGGYKLEGEGIQLFTGIEGDYFSILGLPLLPLLEFLRDERDRNLSMIRSCVIGWPISHSRSPLIHGYWLKKYGIEGAYEKKAIAPENLESFLASLASQGYAGCNVTIPHKEAAFKLAKPDDLARELGAANTLYLRNGVLHSTSTDGEGFIASLKADAPDLALHGKSALVLGAGGAARAIIQALLAQGVERIDLANRTLERAEELSRHFGPRVKPLPWEKASDALAHQSLLVNTTSLGMAGQPPLDLSLDKLSASAVVTDIVYVPLETPLLKEAARRGNRTSGGLGMLLHQAVRGFELWFRTQPQVTAELRALLEADVGKSS